MATQDFYQVLGVSKDANERDIKKAYKRMAMKYHPDRTKGDKEMEIKFKEIKQAYEVLSDPQKRQMYDQYGHEAFEQARQAAVAMVQVDSAAVLILLISLAMYLVIFLVVADASRHVLSAELTYATTWICRWKKRFAVRLLSWRFQRWLSVVTVAAVVLKKAVNRKLVDTVMVPAKFKCAKAFRCTANLSTVSG